MTTENQRIERQELSEQAPFNIDDFVIPLTTKEKQQWSHLENHITTEEAEELSGLFPREIPRSVVEKKTTKSRVLEILLIPKKLQRWRHKR